MTPCQFVDGEAYPYCQMFDKVDVEFEINPAYKKIIVWVLNTKI